MSKYKVGEYLLVLYDGDKHPEHIYGHVTKEQAEAVLRRECDRHIAVDTAIHGYARWLQVGGDSEVPDGCDTEFKTGYAKGRGAMPVTICHLSRKE